MRMYPVLLFLTVDSGLSQARMPAMLPPTFAAEIYSRMSDLYRARLAYIMLYLLYTSSFGWSSNPCGNQPTSNWIIQSRKSRLLVNRPYTFWHALCVS